MSEYKLIKEIISMSEANVWDRAKLEWSLYEVYEADEPETCLCGHFPIIEICTLRNRLNGKLATVGNCCVKKFIGLPSDKIFQAVKQVQKDVTRSLNAEVLEYAYEKNWINKWEREFYFNILHKRNLSTKRAEKKVEINKKIILCMQQSAQSKD